MASLLGVNVDRIISLTFVMGASLAAVAGLMYLLYYGVIDFFIGFVAGIKAFTAAVLGGIGSLPGAMLGGLIIGLIEVFWAGYFTTAYKDVAAFSILAIVLIFFPSGLARQAGDRKGLSHGGSGRRRPLAPRRGRRKLSGAVTECRHRRRDRVPALHRHRRRQDRECARRARPRPPASAAPSAIAVGVGIRPAVFRPVRLAQTAGRQRHRRRFLPSATMCLVLRGAACSLICRRAYFSPCPAPGGTPPRTSDLFGASNGNNPHAHRRRPHRHAVPRPSSSS